MAKSLHNAIQLYEILGQYLPEDIGKFDTALEYVKAIINAIKEGNNHKDYFTAVQLMTGAEYDILVGSGSDAVLDAFIAGLIEWKAYELGDFFAQLGYSHGR